jgi:hypothetical protein
MGKLDLKPESKHGSRNDEESQIVGHATRKRWPKGKQKSASRSARGKMTKCTCVGLNAGKTATAGGGGWKPESRKRGPWRAVRWTRLCHALAPVWSDETESRRIHRGTWEIEANRENRLARGRNNQLATRPKRPVLMADRDAKPSAEQQLGHANRGIRLAPNSRRQQREDLSSWNQDEIKIAQERPDSEKITEQEK